MSKTDDKTSPGPQAKPASGAADVALVQPQAPAKATDTDHGRGGLYRLVNGVRKRIGGTEPAPTQPTKKD